MIVLSLFDGMSGAQIALKELGVPVEKYYASEVDKFAIKQTQLNFPDTIQLGDVNNWMSWDIHWSSIDLVCAGSPCQGFSFAGKQLAFDDPRSKLFFIFAEILNNCREFNPNVKFLLENVDMKKEYLRIISEYVGIFPVKINSALVSAQNRERWYWTNIKTIQTGLFDELYTDISQPPDKGILIRDILQPEEDVDKKYYLDLKKVQRGIEQAKAKAKVWHTGNKMGQMDFPNDVNKKAKTLTTVTTDGGRETNHIAIDINGKAPTQRNSTGRCLDKKYNYQIIKLDRELNVKSNQNKADSLTIGGHGCGNHSDMDIICVNFSHRNEGVRIYEDKVPTLNARDYKELRCVAIHQRGHGFNKGGIHYDKSPTIQASHDWVGNNPLNKLRRLTPIECARLQTIPDWYKFKFVNKVYYGYICKETNVTKLCQQNVKSKTAKERSSVKSQDYAICTISDSSEQEVQKGLKLTHQKSAMPQDAQEMLQPQNTETFAFSITSDLKDMEMLNFQKGQKRPVCLVVKKSDTIKEEQRDFVRHIIEVSSSMEIHYLLREENKQETLPQDQADMFLVEMVEKSTNKSWRINLEGVLSKEKLFITLILGRWIIERGIYTYVNQEANIRLFISNLNYVQSNCLSLDISDLRMDDILSTSDSQIYRMLGNGWTSKVIEWIFGFMENKV